MSSSTGTVVFNDAKIQSVDVVATEGLGVGTINPQSNLHVVGNAYVTSNMVIDDTLDVTGEMNLRSVSNAASIKYNSNVVTEYVRSKKLIKYPRVAMTAGQSGLGSGYTQDGYTIRASSEYNTSYQATNAFSSGDTWITGSSDYSSGVPVSITANTNKFGENGSWLEIKLPEPIKLNRHEIYSRTVAITERIEKFNLWASNTGNDLDWVKLESNTSASSTYTDVVPHVSYINTENLYQYYAIQLTKLAWTGGYGNIGEWELFGIPEYDPEAHGTDVIARSVPNVPNTDWLNLYWDAKNYSGSGDVQDETTNNRDATLNAGFDNGDIKAFTFSGAYTSNVTTSNHGLGTGDVSYTMALWFKRTAVAATYDYLVMAGDGGTSYQSILLWINANKLRLDHWAAQLQYDEEIELNKWYHVVVGHSGGDTPNVANDFMYINGVKTNILPSTNTTTTFNLQGAKLSLGSSHRTTTEFFNGSIANFRLFNRALTADEVWQLYAYQKDYFQVSPDVVTFKGGRLGVGTEEPRATLDVRGNIIGGCPVAFSASRSAGSLSSSVNYLTIVFNKIYTNKGGYYNTKTGIFTAPYDGFYYFHVHGMTANGNLNEVVEMRFLRNDVLFGAEIYGYDGTSGGHTNAAGSITVYLNEGDTMKVGLTANTTFYGGGSYGYNGFSGFFLGT